MSRIIVRHDDGSEVDVTESVRLVYKLLNESMDYGSGFLSIEDVTEITRLAAACGFESIPDADMQLAAYLRTAGVGSRCPTCGEYVRDMEPGDAIDTGRLLTLQPCGHEMELFMPKGEPAGLRPRPSDIDGTSEEAGR